MQSVILTDQPGAGVKGDEKGETRAGESRQAKGIRQTRDAEETEIKLSCVLAR